MRALRLLPVAFLGVVFATSAFACGGSETTSGPTTPDAGKQPDRSVPDDIDSGAPDTGVGSDSGSGADANDAAVSTCPIPSDATVNAQIKMSVDDHFKLYVNGVLVREFAGTWNNVQTVDVTLNRNPTKKNVIAVEGNNAAKISGLDRMIVADLAYTVDATEHRIITDATWTRGTTLVAGWEAIDFAEAGWTAVTVEGTNGDAPYGSILGTSDAKYLWSYDSAQVDLDTKPAVETVYFRKTFYVSQGGAPQAAPGACN